MMKGGGKLALKDALFASGGGRGWDFRMMEVVAVVHSHIAYPIFAFLWNAMLILTSDKRKMEKRVLPLLKKCIQTEDPRELMDCLASVIASKFAAEIEAAFLSRNALAINFRKCRSFSCSPNSSNPSSAYHTGISLINAKQTKISVAAEVVVASRRFREFRLEILDLCSVLVQNLWKTEIEQSADILSSDKVDLRTREYYEDYYEESALPEDFSDANAVLIAPYKGRIVEADIDNMVALIISGAINSPTRRKNLQMLSSSIDKLLKSERELDIILNHLNQILCNSDLFVDTMNLIASLLSMFSLRLNFEMLHLELLGSDANDEASATKICSVMSQVAPNVLRSQHISSFVKVQFANFFIQIFCRASRMWRKFSCANLKIILLHFMELITSEFVGLLKTRKTFLSLASKLDPDVRWFCDWLHSFTFRKIIRQRLVDFITEILESCGEILENESVEQYLPELNFQISLVINCLKYSDLLGHMNFFTMKIFVLQSLELAHGSEEFGNLQTLLLDLSMSISGATFLAIQLVPEICTFRTQFTANLLVNILRYSDQPLNTNSLQSLMQLLRRSSIGNSAFDFQLPRLSNQLGVTHTTHFGTPNSVHRRSRSGFSAFSGIEGRSISMESSVKILAQLLVRYSVQTLSHFARNVRSTIAKLCEPTVCYFGNPAYCRLFLASGFFTVDVESLRAWRRAVNTQQLLTAMLMQPKMSTWTVIGRGGLLPIPHPLDRFTNDGRRLCAKILLNFLLGGSVAQRDSSRFNVKLRRLSVGQMSMNNFSINRRSVSKPPTFGFSTSGKLDFLLSDVSVSTNLFEDFFNSYDLNFLPLSNSVFMFITQPGVLMELLKAIGFTALISEKLSDPSSPVLIDFIKRLECFAANIEVLVELRRNSIIQTKFLRVLQKYCVDRSGQPIVDEFSASVCRFLTKLSSINKPRVNKRDDVEGGYFGHHQGDRSDSFDSFKDDAMMDNALTLPFIHCQQSSFASKNERTRPMLESGYLHQSFRTPIEEEPLLFLKIHAYLDAENIPSFKILSKNGSSMKMTRKMCSAQADWLSPLLDYAVSIGKVLSRQIAQQRCVGLRFIPATLTGDSSGCIASTTDCFLGALFLAGNLDAPATLSLCERLYVYLDHSSGSLKQKENPVVHPVYFTHNDLTELPKVKLSRKVDDSEAHRTNFSEITNNVADSEHKLLEEFIYECAAIKQTKRATFWPLAVNHVCETRYSASITYSDVISTVIYPIVLKIIIHRQMSVLYDFVEQTELPLLHLLLFYSNHCYLGVLEFEQVEEYILFSVMGGAGFQAFHFCAVLQHISETRPDLVHLNVNKMYFLRPSMQNFSFRRYVVVLKQILLDFDE